MVVAAVVLSAVWFLSAVVGRMALQVLRTGDSGLRVEAGARFSPAWWAHVGLTASTLALVAAPVLVSADIVGPVGAVPEAVRWVGAALGAAGVAATFGAQLVMGDSWRIGVEPGEDTELVTAGVFGLVRNPIFSAMVLTALGVTLMVPTALGVAGLVGLVAFLELQVRRVEEPHLLAVHGPRYRTYTTRVGRFLPGLGRSRPSAGSARAGRGGPAHRVPSGRVGRVRRRSGAVRSAD
jgi:protein-S-isoprenylcysteine O-methyltransferase Ste14